MYNIDEIEILYSGDNKKYLNKEHFYKYIEAGHGYTKESSIYMWTIDIVLNFRENLQDKFFTFITGNKKLP